MIGLFLLAFRLQAAEPLEPLPLPEGAPLAGELQAWSTLAVDARPNLITGEGYATGAWRVGLDTPLSPNLRVVGIGGVRARATGEPYTLRGDLWQGALTHTGARHSLELGRLVRIDPRGFQRLDGAQVHFADDRPMQLSAWGGRLWSPLDWKPGETWVVGTQARYAPDAGRVRAPRQHATLGAEVRAFEGGVHTSLMASGATRNPYGDHASGLVEVGIGEDVGLRTDLRAARQLASGLHLGGQLAWNGLPPPNALSATTSPFDWLVRDAYGLANANLTATQGPWHLSTSAGLTAQADRPFAPALGGQLQASAAHHTGPWRISGELRHANIGASGLSGGAVGVGRHAEGLRWTTDTGVWQLRSLDGAEHLVWEARATGDLTAWERQAGARVQTWRLAGGLGAGTDRQLAPWVRGNLALHVLTGRPS